jgi:hypothetical protein
MSEHEQHHPMTAPRGASGLCTAAALPRTCTYLLYQSRLSDQEGLQRYLDTVRPILIKLLRKAKATSSQIDALNHMLSPSNIPVLIEEARTRGQWHRANKHPRGGWRIYAVGNP